MKQKQKIYLVIAGIVVCLGVFLFLFFSQSKKPVLRDYPQIEEAGVIRIVTALDPTDYFVSSDTVSGFIHDMLNGLKQYSGIEFKVTVQNSLDKSFEGLEAGEFDLVARNIPINAQLKTKYLFTESIVHDKLVLVQRKAEYNDSIQPIRSHLQLAGKTLYVPKNSPSLFRLRNLSSEIGDTIYVEENELYQAEQLAMMVAAKELDFTVCDLTTAEALANKLPELDLKTDIGFTHLESWAVRTSSPALLDSLNVWIERFKKTQEYKAIFNKYYR